MQTALGRPVRNHPCTVKRIPTHPSLPQADTAAPSCEEQNDDADDLVQQKTADHDEVARDSRYQTSFKASLHHRIVVQRLVIKARSFKINPLH